MDILILILLIVAGLVLLMVELFVAPGLSIAGIAAGASLIYAVYHAFTELGTMAGIITLVVTLVSVFLFIYKFMHSKTLDKLSLHKNINSKVENEAVKEINEGDTGISLTRLALIGSAEINGNRVEVKSMDGFLDEKTPVVVDHIDGNGVVIVRKQEY